MAPGPFVSLAPGVGEEYTPGMRLLYLLLSLLLPGLAGAANITSATCSSTVTTGCVVLNLGNYTNWRSGSVQITGTWAATLVFEGSSDNSTWGVVHAYPAGGGAFVTSTTANGRWHVNTLGSTYIRVRASAYTSGTAVVTLQPSLATPPNSATAAGSSDVEVRNIVTVIQDPGTIFAIGGPDGGNATFGLSEDDLDQIVAPVCAVVTAQANVVVDGGVHAFPPLLGDGGTSGEINRSSLTGANILRTGGSVLSCDVVAQDGGLPSCVVPGYGRRLYAGDERTWSVPAADTIWCRCCSTDACNFGYSEEVCR